jgi:hypothetical protein
MRILRNVLLGSVAALAVGAVAAPTTAFATDVPGTAIFTAGTFGFTVPASVGFTATVTGVAQVATATQAIDAKDFTGNGAGWNVTLTTTTFTSGANSLADGSLSDTGAAGVCDIAASCTLGDNSVTAYPLTIPSATVAPTAIKIQRAAINTGLAGQTWTHNVALNIPGQVHSGTYASTWTYSFVSAP